MEQTGQYSMGSSSALGWGSGGSLGLYQWDMPGGSDVVVSPLGWFYRNGPAPSRSMSGRSRRDTRTLY